MDVRGRSGAPQCSLCSRDIIPRSVCVELFVQQKTHMCASPNFLSMRLSFAVMVCVGLLQDGLVLMEMLQVIAGAEGELKADACVNLGNTSCAWAEVLEPGPESLRLLEQARTAYQQAANLDPEDASVRIQVLVPL